MALSFALASPSNAFKPPEAGELATSESPERLPQPRTHDAMASAFAAQAAMCTARRDTAHFAFHGCVDWHSAVHGAWALVAYQRRTGDRRYAERIEALLDPGLIASELDYVRERPLFEMPYGRAWFLRLHHEWKAIGGDDRLDALASLIARSLIQRYATQPPNPRADRYGNDSWALINLRLYGETVGARDIIERVDELVRTRFMASTERCEPELENEGFLAVCTTWAWLVSQSATEEAFRAWYADWNPGLESLTPVVEFNSAHDFGRNFSRAWAFAALADATGDERLRSLHASHLEAGYAPETQWRGDYMTNGHWVAQFGMLAIEPLWRKDAQSGIQAGELADKR
jgi:hypothetical protein